NKTMRNFIEDRHSGRRGNDRRGGGNRFGGRRDSGRGQVEMYPAVCDDCGKDCEVPFKPSSDKPIYCSRCFEKQGGYDREERGGREDRGGRRERGRDSDKQMFSAVCDDCGKDCEVPFRPSGDKPIYCSRCFENRGNSHEGEGKREVSSSRTENGCDHSEQKKQFELLNAKLDQILLALEKKTRTVKKVEPIELTEVVKKTKTVKAKKPTKKAKAE
ncbi:MAG: hypothetical protein UR49_C0014G0001, partial [candidate division WS6 bacterium GW2011_GWF2_33_92]